MRRWLVLSLGLGIAAAAAWAVLTARPSRPGTPARADSAEPLDQIDAASRARLEHILREADRAPEEEKRR